MRLFDRAVRASNPIFPPHYFSWASMQRLGGIHKYGQSINSEGFWFSIPGLRAPPYNHVENQREINHAEYISLDMNPDV